MIPVDLNRLREAIGREADEGPMAALWTFAEAGRAVLDAPREYECNWSFSQPTEGCESGLHRTAGLVEGGRCGWVALGSGEGRR